MHEFHTERRIEFADTDMGGIVHFSRFFIFMETAEHELLRALGTSVATEIDGRKVGWPRVAAQCEYKSPARFGDVLEIRVRVLRVGTTSLTYAFSFICRGVELACGRMTSVCCVLDGQAVRPISIPPSIASQIEPAPESQGA